VWQSLAPQPTTTAVLWPGQAKVKNERWLWTECECWSATDRLGNRLRTATELSAEPVYQVQVAEGTAEDFACRLQP
jgi:hypothetical protein